MISAAPIHLQNLYNDKYWILENVYVDFFHMCVCRPLFLLLLN